MKFLFMWYAEDSSCSCLSDDWELLSKVYKVGPLQNSRSAWKSSLKSGCVVLSAALVSGGWLS